MENSGLCLALGLRPGFRAGETRWGPVGGRASGNEQGRLAGEAGGQEVWSCLQIRFQTIDTTVVPTKHCGVVRVTGWVAPRDTGPSGTVETRMELLS